MFGDSRENNGNRITREELLSGMATESTERRGVLKGTLGIFASLIGFSHRSAADDIDRDSLLIASQQYDSEQAIREAVNNHADDLLVELSKRGYLNQPSVSDSPLVNYGLQKRTQLLISERWSSPLRWMASQLHESNSRNNYRGEKAHRRCATKGGPSVRDRQTN